MIKHFHEFQSKFKDIFRKQQKKPAEEYVSPQDRKREIAVYFLQNWEQFFFTRGFLQQNDISSDRKRHRKQFEGQVFLLNCWSILKKDIFGCKEAEIMHLSSARSQSNLKNGNVSESQLNSIFAFSCYQSRCV